MHHTNASPRAKIP